MMKTKFPLLLLCFLSFSHFSYAAPPEGVSYTTKITEQQQVIHILKIDPARFHIIAARALETGKPRETVAAIAKHHNAIAAINGSFFRLSTQGTGLPAGILKLDNHWHGIAYRPRGAIGWDPDKNKVLLDRVQTKTTVKIQQHKYPVGSMNLPPRDKRFQIFTNTYGNPIEANNQVHLTITNNRITDIADNGLIHLPTTGYVYRLGTHKNYPLLNLSVGDKAMINVEVLPQRKPMTQKDWAEVPFIMGGAPLLISNSEPISDFSPERLRKQFINDRYARTAVGILSNGHWVFVVAEENSFLDRPGLTIHELVDMLHNLGCVEALNLDGGGSSTMYLANKIINHTEGDEDEDYGLITVRRVSDALLVIPN